MYNIVNTGNRITSVRLTLATPPVRAMAPSVAVSTATPHGREASAFARFPVNIHENS